MYDINDFDFQKDTIIETPLQLSKFLYNKVKRKGFKQVLDIGSHKGNLSKYFKNVVGLDIEDAKIGLNRTTMQELDRTQKRSLTGQ